MFDLVDYIMRFEDGSLGAEETVTLFEHLIATGQAWSLQGFYGRTAAGFIDEGLIDKSGVRTALATERLATI